ncbi:MAG: biotin/lipoyl-binding protein [Bradymonadales bacterium]|jgi:HlyD family secretion protein
MKSNYSSVYHQTGYKKRVLLSLWFILLATVALSCEDFSRISATREAENIVTGLVNATEIDIASKVPGRVEQLYVREGDRVLAGDDLVSLKIDELDAKLRQATTSIDAAQAQLALARKGARPQEKTALKRQVDSAKAQADISAKMLARMSKLYDEGALPQAKFDEAVFKHDLAQNQLAMAEAKYEAVVSGARGEELRALEALVAKGMAVVEELEVYKEEAIQKAPINAEVAKIYLHEGELANTGYPILSLVVLDDSWGSFAIREDYLRNLKIGDSVQLYIPALAKHAEFKVSHIAVMGDFATWRATSERNRFDLKSFEVKLRPAKPIDNLRPGMTLRWNLALGSKN